MIPAPCLSPLLSAPTALVPEIYEYFSASSDKMEAMTLNNLVALN